MTGKTTLFPNTAKDHIFDDQPDEENPRADERCAKRYEWNVSCSGAHLWVRLPTEDMNAVTILGFVTIFYLLTDAWTRGKLRHAHPWRRAI